MRPVFEQLSAERYFFVHMFCQILNMPFLLISQKTFQKNTKPLCVGSEIAEAIAAQKESEKKTAELQKLRSETEKLELQAKRIKQIKELKSKLSKS